MERVSVTDQRQPPIDYFLYFEFCNDVVCSCFHEIDLYFKSPDSRNAVHWESSFFLIRYSQFVSNAVVNLISVAGTRDECACTLYIFILNRKYVQTTCCSSLVHRNSSFLLFLYLSVSGQQYSLFIVFLSVYLYLKCILPKWLFYYRFQFQYIFFYSILISPSLPSHSRFYSVSSVVKFIRSFEISYSGMKYLGIFVEHYVIFLSSTFRLVSSTPF